jgi:hypothetical protein
VKYDLDCLEEPFSSQEKRQQWDCCGSREALQVDARMMGSGLKSKYLKVIYTYDRSSSITCKGLVSKFIDNDQGLAAKYYFLLACWGWLSDFIA